MSLVRPVPSPSIGQLPNGVRVIAIPMPWLDSVSLSVFVRAGSQHENARANGISHVVEHMAFKGTESRDCQRINLDAERLGGEVNAHTDKDHTAFHIHGLAQHAVPFLHMLADIVRYSNFPEAELERERQVILQEFAEDEDDPLSTAYKLFDRNCFGRHPLAQAVIGTRANIRRFTRADLLDYVHRHYTGANVVVAVAGNIDADVLRREAEIAFGTMPAGPVNSVAAPEWRGGLRERRQAGSSQSHVVLGFPLPSLAADDPAGELAAAVFGEGMSSPLLDELRERRGLVYHASCSADVLPAAGQFVIEASMAPEHLDPFFDAVAGLLLDHAAHIHPVSLERARNQLAVRSLRTHERPFRRLEEAVQQLCVQGRVRPRAEQLERLQAIGAGEVGAAFQRLLAQAPALAIVGKLKPGAGERFSARLAAAR
ncbi:insulinase family protein [Aquincola sp. S2]|uniref:Insulinase family protein n=1 Tax=Pseudaquabacterium terrae TaxID=2732868 RepID=A0ABX2EKD6_9BURK|nr:pitrilysin family protein [Aquabacterium terrae]NRF69037.1 insulinase family protein [Aquabacterium terrae]